MDLLDQHHSREYRKSLQFRNQSEAKIFFGGKDIGPDIDYDYINRLNDRLHEIIFKINSIVSEELVIKDLSSFCDQNIYRVFAILKNNGILSRLTNLGRRVESVYFSWMRGYIIVCYFQKALSLIFEVRLDEVILIGEDDLRDVETFNKSPKADLEILYEGNKLRIEVQSGFQGVNDIKRHKVLEAKKMKETENIPSIVIHFDLFNAQVAFVKIYDIDEDNVHWITRQQLEGQTVFNIDQNYFIWKLTDPPPKFIDLQFTLD
jgi:hypothetical protein